MAPIFLRELWHLRVWQRRLYFHLIRIRRLYSRDMNRANKNKTSQSCVSHETARADAYMTCMLSLIGKRLIAIPTSSFNIKCHKRIDYTATCINRSVVALVFTNWLCDMQLTGSLSLCRSFIDWSIKGLIMRDISNARGCFFFFFLNITGKKRSKSVST